MTPEDFQNVTYRLHIVCCGLFLLFKRSKFIQYKGPDMNSVILWDDPFYNGNRKSRLGREYFDFIMITLKKKQRVELRLSFGDQFYLFCFNIGFFVMKLRDKKLKITLTNTVLCHLLEVVGSYNLPFVLNCIA